MDIKLLILFLVINTTLAQNNYNLMCTFDFVNDLCTCAFLIYNPEGLNHYTIGGNPIANCSFDDTVQVIAVGETLNIPPVICDSFPKLKVLQMEGLKIQTIEPSPFLGCKALKTLMLRNNEIVEISPYTFLNTVLETLNLNRNKLINLDAYSFYNLRQLKDLNLQSNPGIRLPSTVFDPLASLNSLDLRNCDLLDMNAGWFGKLMNLTDLHLSFNLFPIIPNTAFQNLTNLVNLDMSSGKISSMPSNSFINNENLKILRLNNNNLSSLHADIFENQENLEILSLSMNEFSLIPPTVFKPLKSLRKFFCTSCNIAEIKTEWFTTTKNLDSVDLSCNHIRHIPANTFASTNELMFLYINNNNITNLNSRSFGSLKNLYTLDARNNQLNEIDHHFMNQSTLQSHVYFSENKCVQLNTTRFIDSKAYFIEQMRECFNNFDRIMIDLETYNSTNFDWHNIRQNDEWEAIRVSIKAFENVHIGLTDELNKGDPLVEVRLGERDNRESSIYERSVRVFIDNQHYRLSENEMRTFIIGWRFGVLMVYEEAARFPFMAHFIRESFPVNFFGLRTQINSYNSNSTAIWNVSRIKGNEFLPMSKTYEEIEGRIKHKMPIDLRIFLK